MSLAVNVNLEDVSSKIKHAASQALGGSEEDLRFGIERILRDSVLDPLGIDTSKYEVSTRKFGTLLTGARIDALHGHVIIEYERPRSFENRTNFEHAIQQVKDGIVRHARGVLDNLPRYFGVVLDGFSVGFVRYKQRLNDFDVSKDPLEVNKSTVARLVEAMIGLRRRALGVEELLQDFGPSTDPDRLSNRVIRVLYDKMIGKVSDRTSILFSDWKRVFSQVCAYDPLKLSGLEEQYGFRKGGADTEKLLFSLHSYFALLMKFLAAEVASLNWSSLIGSYLKVLEDSYYRGPEKLKDQLKELEEGGLFARFGIFNFLEGDYFSWYLDEWDSKLADTLASLVRKLSD